MVSREHKRVFHEKLLLLRSVTNSRARNEASIIVDASKYIEDLKNRVEKLNRDIACQRSFHHDISSPLVNVEALGNNFLITVFSKDSCPGMTVAVLEAFEELGLNVLDARVSCADTFRLEAVGGEIEGDNDTVDESVVKQAVMKAIKNCRTSDEDF
ncbi:transcription factor bHLH61-like [Wolffia australiana]